ncbi:MAG: membrane protease YdiL (CAAX protease family) [Crocinitomicaceae bacterium]|jgi:membrane protease YdiL (CAAX protease family)
MQFVEQDLKGTKNRGVNLLTLALTLLGFLVGNFVTIFLVTTFNIELFSETQTTDSNLILVLLLIPFIFVLAALMLCIKYLHKRPVLSLFTSREKFDWKRFFISFTVMGIALAGFLFYSFSAGADIEWNFESSTFIPLLLVSFLILPMQTAAEDALFRGFLFQSFGRFFKHAGLSILITGILFGLLHAGNPEVAKIGCGLLAYYISSGIFLGIMTHMDDGMELGMGYHAVNNIFAAVILTNNWQAFQTDALLIDNSPPQFGWESILTLLILQPLLLLLFARIYKWKNWKKKLINSL